MGRSKAPGPGDATKITEGGRQETDKQVQRRLEAKFTRLEQQRVKLLNVFAEHFPKTDVISDLYYVTKIDNQYHCNKIIEFVWDPKKELEKLEKLEEAIDIVCNLHENLNRRVRDALNNDNVKLDWLISDLQRGAPSAIGSAIAEVMRGVTYGKNNLNCISLIGVIRSVWEARTGKPAPKSWNPETPFGRFASDVFGALNAPLEPSSAMRAWRRQMDT